MPTIHLTTGLPASGKTTHARELMAQASGRMRRINLDDIRAMLDDHGGAKVWTHKHEATAQRIQEDALRAALAGGWDVVVDNTHLTPRMPGRLKQVAAKRAILAIHKMVTQVWTEDIGPTDDPYLTEAGEHGSGCAHCHDTGLGEIAPDGPCVTLKALASVWADHPDFAPAWSVTR